MLTLIVQFFLDRKDFQYFPKSTPQLCSSRLSHVCFKNWILRKDCGSKYGSLHSWYKDHLTSWMKLQSWSCSTETSSYTVSTTWGDANMGCGSARFVRADSRARGRLRALGTPLRARGSLLGHVAEGRHQRVRWGEASEPSMIFRRKGADQMVIVRS